MQDVSIIILTYNSAKYIDDLIKSMSEFAKGCEILVIDNNSTDDTVVLAKKLNGVKIFETGKNLGFAKGINYGAKEARGKYLLFINPDTVYKNGELGDLVSVFAENKKIGVVGGKLINNNGISEKSAGKFFNLFQTILIIFGLDEKFGVRYSPDKLSKVDFVSGGFMMARTDIFNKLHGLDENFFMYVEDMEFCYRVKKEGFETFFTPNVVFSHTGQGSSNRTFAIVNIYKGILYFYKKHKNILEYYLVKILLSLKALVVYLLGIILNNSNYKNTYKEAFLEIK